MVDTSTYFTNYANDDYTLLQSDVDSWGIEGIDATTPATDYANTVRAHNSIGPYEYVASNRGTSKTLSTGLSRPMGHVLN